RPSRLALGQHPGVERLAHGPPASGAGSRSLDGAPGARRVGAARAGAAGTARGADGPGAAVARVRRHPVPQARRERRRLRGQRRGGGAGGRGRPGLALGRAAGVQPAPAARQHPALLVPGSRSFGRGFGPPAPGHHHPALRPALRRHPGPLRAPREPLRHAHRRPRPGQAEPRPLRERPRPGVCRR
ncbi:hypothetical protein H632_c5429p0, partial [Helicosporidium sp. ATCC 50920]